MAPLSHGKTFWMACFMGPDKSQTQKEELGRIKGAIRGVYMIFWRNLPTSVFFKVCAFYVGIQTRPNTTPCGSWCSWNTSRILVNFIKGIFRAVQITDQSNPLCAASASSKKDSKGKFIINAILIKAASVGTEAMATSSTASALGNIKESFVGVTLSRRCYYYEAD